jgi:predicted enzyme related to lactoylglutathione lyase
MSDTPRSFIWYELMTSDMESAVAFYSAVIGWRTQDGRGDWPYTVVSAGDAMVAGIMPLPPKIAGSPPAWLGYIGVADVDAASEKLKAGGGAIHREPSDIPGIGRFSVAADPQGAVFLLFTPQSGEPPAESGMAPGRVGWRELHTTDWQAAFDFYAGQFGWTKAQAVDMGAMGTYQLFAAGSLPVGGMMNRHRADVPPYWLYYFSVEAIDPAVAKLDELGGKLLNGPMEVPGGAWVVQAMDPQGAIFALVAPKR